MPLTPDEILERSQWDFFWVPDDVSIVDRPELAYLSCPRDRQYLNMVTRTRGAAPERLPELVAEVVSAHAGRRSRWLVPPTFDSAALRLALADRGYAEDDAYRVSVIDCASYQRRAAPDRVDVSRVGSLEALEAAFSVTEAAFGDPGPRTSSEPERDLAKCRGQGARIARYLARDADSGEPLACGNMTIFEALSFGLLWGGGTIPAARGRGLYSAVLAARVDAALAGGLKLVGLLANVETSAPIVAKQGFSQHGVARYWERPAR